MRLRVRKRFWLEVVLAVTTASFALPAVISGTWIESVSGLEPDRRSGSLEWAAVGVLAMTSLLAALAARVEWGRRWPADAVA